MAEREEVAGLGFAFCYLFQDVSRGFRNQKTQVNEIFHPGLKQGEKVNHCGGELVGLQQPDDVFSIFHRYPVGSGRFVEIPSLWQQYWQGWKSVLIVVKLTRPVLSGGFKPGLRR